MERIQRVNQLIKKELSQIILKEFDFPQGVLATLTRVESAGNLIQAKVYVSVLPETKSAEVLKNLNRRIYDLQQKLNRRLKMRPMPKIIFIEERATAEAGRVEELLETIKTQNAKHKSQKYSQKPKTF